jgi:hypothetical protein
VLASTGALLLAARGGAAPGSCGNRSWRLPSSDLASRWVEGTGAPAFERACQQHDRCYNTRGATKRGCDRAMLRAMRAGCRDAYRVAGGPAWLARVGAQACGIQAATYYAGVTALPPFTLAWCNEQYYARVGARRPRPGPLTALWQCRR